MTDPFDADPNDPESWPPAHWDEAPFGDGAFPADGYGADFDGGDWQPPHVPWWRHWMPAIVATVVSAVVVGGIVFARQSSQAVPTTTTTLPAGVCPAGSPITCFPLTRTIKRGMQGEDVRRIQQRLKDLKFDPGAIDGIYGGDTMMAVWAFQALVLQMPRATLVDFVTPPAWDVMRGDVVIKPRRQPGTPAHVEVYLPEQVMTVWRGAELTLVTHISSGTGQTWCEEVVIDPGELGNKTDQQIKEGWCGEAITPPGVYYFYNRKVGTRESKLGTMWNPVYFNFGIAVHGAMQVPKEPASHGCIRIPQFISEYFPDLVKFGDRVYVFNGVKEPEFYGSQPPPWDKPDPNYTTTTSTTPTTTVPKSARTTVPKSPTTVTTSSVP